MTSPHSNIITAESNLCNSFVSMSNNNFCMYCNRHFHFKDLYDQHVTTCEFFYRTRRQKDRDADLHEQLPSPQEQYKLIQYLMIQVAKLQKENIQLKGAANTKKRKVIMEWLQSSGGPKPSMHFGEWINTVSISIDNLFKVFDGDLVEGMKHCLETYFATTKSTTNTNLPIYAFVQKPGSIYIYANEPVFISSNTSAANNTDSSSAKWIILSPEVFDGWMNRLAHRFLQEFIKWQLANSAQIYATDESKEKNVDNLRKVNGLMGKAYEERRRAELRKWLFNKLAQDFTHLLVEYE